MVNVGIFNSLAIFLTATLYFVMLINLLMHIRTVFLCVIYCDWWFREFGLCVFSYSS